MRTARMSYLHWTEKNCRNMIIALLFGGCTPKSQQAVPSVSPQEANLPSESDMQDPIAKAERLLQQGQAQAALAIFEQELQHRPNDYQMHYGRGVALQSLGRSGEAIQAWESSLQIKPDFVAALNGIGASEYELKNYEKAVKALQKAVEIDPNFADAQFNLGLALRELGQLDAAMQTLHEAQRLKPEDADVYLALADVYAQQKQWSQALEQTGRALQIARDQIHVQYAHGKMLWQNRRYTDAVHELKQVLRQEPEWHEARLTLAHSLVGADRIPEALEQFSHLAKQIPNEAVVWSDWGAALAKQGELTGPEGALHKFEQALALDKNLVSAHLRKVQALVSLKRCKEAKEALLFAQKLPTEAKNQLQALVLACRK